jgi:hypothetical protein
MLRISLAVTCLCVFIACSQSSPISPDVLPASELTSAPTRIVLGGRTLTLDASLWRDFMPVSPPDGKPLAGALRIKTEDGSAVPAGVAADTAWVVHLSEVWSTLVIPQPRENTAPVYEVSVMNGPKWGPNVTVDVIVRLRDSTGHAALLRARGQTIGATW